MIKCQKKLLYTPKVGLTNRNAISQQASKISSKLISIKSDGWDDSEILEVEVDQEKDYKLDNFSHYPEKSLELENHNFPKLFSVDLDETNGMIAIGFDIFKNGKDAKPTVEFSEAVEMIRFIIELERRVTIIQRQVLNNVIYRLFRRKISSYSYKPYVSELRVKDHDLQQWKTFNSGIGYLHVKFPNLFRELQSNPCRMLLKSHLEKIKNIGRHFV